MGLMPLQLHIIEIIYPNLQAISLRPERLLRVAVSTGRHWARTTLLPKSQEYRESGHCHGGSIDHTYADRHGEQREGD